MVHHLDTCCLFFPDPIFLFFLHLQSNKPCRVQNQNPHAPTPSLATVRNTTSKPNFPYYQFLIFECAGHKARLTQSDATLQMITISVFSVSKGRTPNGKGCVEKTQTVLACKLVVGPPDRFVLSL
mmetsp:Transcript_21949/g.39487  ORF Transcript_21949/g.39487 Transcript_21949/m.39487 type:complete len:125 (-) Transcript_21949:291-665(-)